MAAPNGATVYTHACVDGLFLINRGVAGNARHAERQHRPLNLPCYIPATGPAASTFNAKVDSARSAGGWVILVHGFTGSSDGAYQPVRLGQMTSGIKHTKSLGDMWIGSMVNVGAYWLGQKAFTQATTTTSGSDKTWTWTLPAHFPPGPVPARDGRRRHR